MLISHYQAVLGHNKPGTRRNLPCFGPPLPLAWDPKSREKITKRRTVILLIYGNVFGRDYAYYAARYLIDDIYHALLVIALGCKFPVALACQFHGQIIHIHIYAKAEKRSQKSYDKRY